MKTKEELQAAHGTPDAFEAAVEKAADHLFCTTGEALAAVERYRAEYELAPSVTARMAVAFLLTRIGSWTSARWDQHLRNEIGDAAADEAIGWIERSFRVAEFGAQPASKAWVSPQHSNATDGDEPK